jgi:tetratricopeptide (TPR) repeat protein
VRRCLLIVATSIAGCGVRAPSPVDVGALVRAHGEVEARRTLAVRVIEDPRDVEARLGLAALADATGRPSEAIEQLEAVLALGGPLGTRWHDEDRTRLGTLLAGRGRARLGRGAATALADLDRARRYGAAVSDGELAGARAALAITELRHIDPGERARGRVLLASLAPSTPGYDPSWRAARPGVAPAERAGFGAWLWAVGARREAYEQLAAWHATARPPREPSLQAAYLRALAWWSPVALGEVPPPLSEDLVGPERCWFAIAACAPPEAVAPALPAVELGGSDVRSAAAAHYAHVRVAGAPDEVALRAVASAFRRDGAIADRLGRELIARATDAAPAHAALGALFDALGDPSRARAAWQAAVDASAEPAFVRGLSIAIARAGDASAALVIATGAAAAWGDPAAVWLSLARALDRAGQHVEALVAAHSAIDLAGPELIGASLDVAISASEALGRTSQVSALGVQRAMVAPRAHEPDDGRAALAAYRGAPNAGTVARMWVVSRARPQDLELHVELHDALAIDDPRRATIDLELAVLAGDPDDERAFAAIEALRR